MIFFYCIYPIYLLEQAPACCCAQAEKIGTDATTAAAARRVIANIALLPKLVRAPAKRAHMAHRLASAAFQAHIGGARPRPTLTAGA
jgi:hypothetical protein